MLKLSVINAIIFHFFIAFFIIGTSTLFAKVVLRPGTIMEWIVPDTISNIHFIYIGKEGETIISRKINVVEGEKFLIKIEK